MSKLIQRLCTAIVQAALRSGILSCQGKIVEGCGEFLFPTLDGQTARRFDVSHVSVGERRVFSCFRRSEYCEVCPRFKAFREAVFRPDDVRHQLNMPLSPSQCESNVGDGHGEGTEVHHLNQQAFTAVVKHGPAGLDPDFYPVIAECSPSVEKAQGRSKNGNPQADIRNDFSLHGTNSTAGRQQ